MDNKVSQIAKASQKYVAPDYYPEAVGFSVIVAPVKIPQLSAGGIVLPLEAQQAHGMLRYIGRVVSMGGSCYSHPMFNNEPWCELGDWVIYGQHAGQIIKMMVPKGIEDPFATETENEKRPVVELKVLKDDQIWAKTLHPENFSIYAD